MGCFLFITFFILGFAHWGFWVLAVSFLFIGIASRPSSSSQTVSKTPEIVPDDLDNILQSLSQGEIKDPVTQETFRSGEKVYLCHTHRLAYHEDSWQEMGCRCMVCGHNGNIRDYILPTPIQIAARKQANELIEWEDLK
ncbi:MAG: hypothetical protein F6K48_11720 [Okeania sp. SIO3H1]|uniref:hypothetical protein n=1 Tax=Okeania sp. SIO1I7 TaxID=2607772 RepID=UPI0013C610D4|nr:hypothetical protein [Okeania sp. SIO1I7]NEN89528.1 hypothetical protein [Okeania sp. SIO3H1]NET30096.1 hypothetical protein [Okeania sp. SIO1I7]